MLAFHAYHQYSSNDHYSIIMGSLQDPNPSHPTSPTHPSYLNQTIVNNWSKANNWCDLVKSNLKTIVAMRNSPVRTDWSVFDGRNNDTIKRIKFLHAYGFIVTDSQDIGMNEGMELEDKKTTVGMHYQKQKRAYLRCVLPTNHPDIPIARIKKLVQILFHFKCLELVWYYDYSEYQVGFDMDGGRQSRPVGSDTEEGPNHKWFWSSIDPSASSRTLCKHRYAFEEQRLDWHRWTKSKRPQMLVITEEDLPKETIGRRSIGREFPLTKQMECIIITMASKNWPPATMDLPLVLLRACIESDMEPKFMDAVKGTEGAHTKKTTE